ncbi:MAG: response regulator [Vicinamibacterales bacterium]
MKRHRILVVEDDVELANMYRAALRFAGFEVHTARDGLTALQALDADRPDLVVLDLRLPTIRGEAVLEEIAASDNPASPPVIVVTGGDPSRAVAQASAVLRKPCSPDLLITAIEHRLRAD